MQTTTLIWLIPVPPILAFALIVLFTNRSKALSHSIAVGAAFLSWLLSMIVFARALGVENLGREPSKPPFPGSQPATPGSGSACWSIRSLR